MLDVLKGHLDDAQLQPAKVEELFGKQMTGTLTSPCETPWPSNWWLTVSTPARAM
jgi:hypothetical protein